MSHWQPGRPSKPRSSLPRGCSAAASTRPSASCGRSGYRNWSACKGAGSSTRCSTRPRASATSQPRARPRCPAQHQTPALSRAASAYLRRTLGCSFALTPPHCRQASDLIAPYSHRMPSASTKTPDPGFTRQCRCRVAHPPASGPQAPAAPGWRPAAAGRAQQRSALPPAGAHPNFSGFLLNRTERPFAGLMSASFTYDKYGCHAAPACRHARFKYRLPGWAMRPHTSPATQGAGCDPSRWP